MATLIAVMNDADWTALPQRHVERLEHQLGTQVIGHRTAHNPPAEGVDDDRQKQESGPGRHVGYIRNPQKVRCIGFKPALNEVRCRTEPVVAARGACSLAPGYPGEPHLSHQPGDALAADPDTVGGKFGVNAGRSVSAAAAMMDVADAVLEDSVVLLSRRQLTVSPSAVPARGDAEQPGHLGDGEAGLIRSHELECFAGTEPVSRANQAVAFANISRSRRS